MANYKAGAAMSNGPPGGADGPERVCAPVTDWRPEGRFDLISCVHGLHYVGDKLAPPAGPCSPPCVPRDCATTRAGTGSAAPGYREIAPAYTYLGADDRAGPNYTGQPAVNSFYAPR